MNMRKQFSHICLLLVLLLAPFRASSDDDDDAKNAIAIPSHVTVVNGETVINYEVPMQKRMGIVSVALSTCMGQSEERTTATVLPVQQLLTLRSSYLAAEVELEKAQATASVSEQEYARLKGLYEHNQNASLKSLEAAQGLSRVDTAAVNAAKRNLELARLVARQDWGPVVASWVQRGGPELDRVLTDSILLVQVTAPTGSYPVLPHTITLSTTAGPMLQAHYVSVLPRVDALIQRSTSLYATPSRAQLAPGMNLVARLPLGPTHRGVIVPYAAVVWWHGQSWAYVQTARDRFVRKQVSTSAPQPTGYFVASGFDSGTRVVSTGAQFLLSEEFRSAIQPED
jgi:multidrug efflux system membrane fusion protein